MKHTLSSDLLQVLSSYELARLERIRANRESMDQMVSSCCSPPLPRATGNLKCLSSPMCPAKEEVQAAKAARCAAYPAKVTPPGSSVLWLCSQYAHELQECHSL